MPFRSKIITPDNARIRLENLCARSEHCEWELREKLRQWNVSPGDRDAILSELRKSRFYDDHRYASAYVRDKMGYNKWGKRKIYLGLASKRIPKEIISDALAEIDEEQYKDGLITLMRAKASRIMEGNTYEGRTKLFRAVASRGFETSLITDIIRKERIWPEQISEKDETGTYGEN